MGPLSQDAWEEEIPAAIRRDPLWRMHAYRLSVQMVEAGRSDVAKLVRCGGMRSVADQLNRALGSIGANIAEGYGRSSGPDRVRFYEMALGSARESRHWYLVGREVVGRDQMEERLATLSRLVRLLLGLIPAERSRRIRKEP